MKKLVFTLILIVSTFQVFAEESEDLGRAKIKASNFHLGLDLQTKYIWRGMEMMKEDASPVLFPGINYQYNRLCVYVLGGYAINGKYAEVDCGISYSWKGVTIGLNDYYYPTVNSLEDNYFKGGRNTGHWLEACITYSPKKVPIWITGSNFFAGADRYINESGDIKQAYSSYIELGGYYDFQANNKISLAVGAALNRSCYNGYRKDFSFCNIELKYSYNVEFKNGWAFPISVAYLYNPVYDKSFVNLTVNLAF